MELPEGYTCEDVEGGFALTAGLSCPMSEARCLAVVCASWVREAAGGEGGKILWPNRVVRERGGEPLCPVECRAAAAGVRFTFRPAAELGTSPEVFREAVLRAAVRDLSGYPANRAKLMEAYCQHCLTVMKFVNVTYRGVPLYGFAFAVDKHGGLMVMTQESHTVVTVYGGTAEIVKKEDAPDNAPKVPRMPGR